MSAEVFGGGTYGTADETSGISIYTAQVRMSASVDPVWGENHIGEEAMVALTNEKADLTFTGILSTADTVNKALAGVLQAADIANSDIFANDYGGTVFYVVGIDLTRNAKGFQQGELSTTSRAALTDTTATTVS